MAGNGVGLGLSTSRTIGLALAGFSIIIFSAFAPSFHFRLLQPEHLAGIVGLNHTYPHFSHVQSYALVSLIMAL